MKKYLIQLFLGFFIVSFVFSGTPTIDGSFDGESVWGTPIATADGTSGWANANSKKVYITNDDTYVYFGAEVTASTWMAWAFLVNTKTGGGSNESWSRSIDYSHSDLPDYIPRGHFDGYAEFHTWNGTAWDGVGNSLASTEFGENITGPDQDGWIEIRISRASLGNASVGDIQFYITGDQESHGTFDACPDDENADQWDESGSHTVLDNYLTDASLPVELTTFSATSAFNTVTLQWETASEIDNLGFAILRSAAETGQYEELDSYLTDAGLRGAGTVSHASEYEYVDRNVLKGETYWYKLVDVDINGRRTEHGPVSVTVAGAQSELLEPVANAVPDQFNLGQNYPNPFNPETQIPFSIPETEAGQTMVQVTIYNVLGYKVRELLSTPLPAGQYKLNWDARDSAGQAVASGVYLYKIETPQFSKTRKMVLMR